MASVVLAELPHLLFAQACGCAHGVIPNNRIDACRLLGLMLQGKITKGDIPSIWLDAVAPQKVRQKVCSSWAV